MTRPVLVVAAAAALLLGGCAASPGGADADAVVHEFYAAVADDDGDAACALLAPSALENLEDDTGEPCPDAVLAGDVGTTLVERAPAGPATSVHVAGRAAQVVLPDDVTFLTVDGDSWRLTAAGCDARPQRPYDCVIEGG